MLQRRVEVDVVRDLEGQVQLNSGEWDRPVRVERQRSAEGTSSQDERPCAMKAFNDGCPKTSPSSARSSTPSPARQPIWRPRRAGRRRRSRSRDAERPQLVGRLGDRAAAEAAEQRAADACDLRRARCSRSASAFAERRRLGTSARIGSSSPGKAQAAKARKPCCPSRATAWCRPAVALKTSPSSRQRRDQRRLRRRRNARAAAAHLRAQAERGEPLEVYRQLDVDLLRQAGHRLRLGPGPRLDRLDSGIATRVVRVEHERAARRRRAPQPSCRHHEPAHEPRLRRRPCARVLGQRVLERHARRREERRVVDQLAERGAAGIGDGCLGHARHHADSEHRLPRRRDSRVTNKPDSPEVRNACLRP